MTGRQKFRLKLAGENGTFLSSLDLGYAIGAILLGLIATHTTYALMYRLSAFFLAAFAAIYGYHIIKTRKPSAGDTYEKNIA